MRLVDCALGPLVLRLRIARRYLRSELASQGVAISISDGCLEDLVQNANETTLRTQRTDGSDLACLHRHLSSRARFVLLWTTTDERFDRDIWAELISIAQKHALPRPRKHALEVPCPYLRVD